MNIDENLTGKALYDFLIANKSVLIAQKKYNIKHSDAFRLSNYTVNDKGEVSKAAAPPSETADTIKVTSLINTTFWMDSHKDVHVDGLWKKSLSENKSLYLLQEHSMTFKGIITDDVTAFTKRYSWKSLGVDAEGETEALVFVSNIPKSRNEFMFNEYRLNRVKNHSVGMRYVKIEMAINDEDYKEEFAVWNKWYDKIANKQEANDSGFFWAVTEAKAVEGSAVPIGSNKITPTLEVKTDTLEQPPLGTGKEPSQTTFDLMKAIQVTKFI